jgi:hypothetical protein
MSIILALGRLRQEDPKLMASQPGQHSKTLHQKKLIILIIIKTNKM